MNCEKVVDHIVTWLGNYAKESKQMGFVVGISGGIDSALTSTLCSHTGLPTLCLSMPIHQSQNQIARASNHILWLQSLYPNVRHEQVELSFVFDSMVAVLPSLFNEEVRNRALANTRARMRMTVLYYFAGVNHFLVAGTGNKVEDFGVGFYTKYGDGGVDLSPIADLTKTEVYELAGYLNIDKDIINAPPTDGLWGDDRTDEQQLGATYPELEWAMEMSNKKYTSQDFSGRKKQVFDIYQHLHAVNLHKMVPIPVCEIPANLKK